MSPVWVSWVRVNNLRNAPAGSISLLQPTELAPTLSWEWPPRAWGSCLAFFAVSLVCHTATWADGTTASGKGAYIFFVSFCYLSQWKGRQPESASAGCGLLPQRLFPFLHLRRLCVSRWPGQRAGAHYVSIPAGAQAHCVMHAIHYHAMQQSLERELCPSLDFLF